MFHIRLNQILKKEIYVTISTGISWSDFGFSEDMIPLADAALYHVKSNGRAGCCIFDNNHQILYEWKDEIKENTGENALEENYTGAGRIELPNGDPNKGRLICNEVTRSLMGFDHLMTPEECFKAWEKGIDPYYREMINKTRATLIEKGQAECSYLYHHPVMGRIMVRSGGKCLINKEGIVFYGYHQSLHNTRIILQEDDSQKLIEAMMGLYFGSYYVDLQENVFFVFKSTEEARRLEKQDIQATVATQNYVQELVKPEYRKEMSEFVDLRTLPERLKDREYVETEYESEIADKGWCRARIMAVRRNDDGVVTHVQILVASIDKEKKQK